MMRSWLELTEDFIAYKVGCEGVRPRTVHKYRDVMRRFTQSVNGRAFDREAVVTAVHSD